ncbi:MAG: ribosomal-protein-alanine N-acetyltransferase [Calditrichaeota bacterium]|nr:MAG: ribosomal-protein-alanine N-acetyltransferase [Calditrichota bacterium]
MSDFSIRKMQESDISRVLEISQKTETIAQWTEKQFFNELQRADSFCFVLGEDVFGFAVCWKVLDEFEISQIAISQDFRREGLGWNLLDFLLSFAKENSCNLVNLEVMESNFPALELYKKAGFEIVGKRKNYYSNSQNALLLTLDLREF